MATQLEAWWRAKNAPPREPQPQLHKTCLVIEGFYVDPNTGILRRSHLDLDENARGHYRPIYYYNRSWRFIGLFNLYNISFLEQGKVLKHFEAVERVWEAEKEKYTRVYFLTQKLLLQSICLRLDIVTTQDPRRPISDLKRYNAQMLIFEELWKIVLTNKNVETAARRESAILSPVCSRLGATIGVSHIHN